MKDFIKLIFGSLAGGLLFFILLVGSVSMIKSCNGEISRDIEDHYWDDSK